MATFTKLLLSGSTNGKQIKVVATATPGTLIHTAVAGTTDLDEIWIYVMNSGLASKKITLEWGEATAPDGNLEASVPGESGLILLVPGLLLQNGLELRAFCETANVVLVNGFVNRIGA